MKKRIIVLAGLVMVMLLSGCAGMQNATVSLDDEKNEIKFSSNSVSLLVPPPSPGEMGRLLVSRATAKMIGDMANGNVGKGISANYKIGIVNNDSSKSAYFFHPEIPGLRIDLPSRGGFFILPVHTMPGYIILYNSSGSIIQKLCPLRDLQTSSYDENSSAYKKTMAGVEVDIRYSINKIY